MPTATFRLRIMSLIRVLFDAEVESVYLTGDEGEYELLPFHYPLLGALPESEIRVAKHENIPIRAGAVSFLDNQCIILIEEVNAMELLKRKRAVKAQAAA